MRRLIPALLLLLWWLPTQAAPTWFWRCEGTTFDGTHDHANGSADSTATINGSASLSSTAARVGTNGCLSSPGSSDQFRFDTSTDMVDRLVGSLAFSLRLDTAPTGARGIVLVAGTDGNFVVQIVGDEVRVYNNLEGTGEDNLITADANLAEDVWYGVVFRWDQPNDLRRIEIYDAAGSLVGTPAEEATAWTAAANLVNSDGLRIGNTTGDDGNIHIDNFFIADSYAEPLEDFLDIASFTDYGGGGGSSAVPIIMQQH